MLQGVSGETHGTKGRLMGGRKRRQKHLWRGEVDLGGKKGVLRGKTVKMGGI